jgi:hypothetical protein
VLRAEPARSLLTTNVRACETIMNMGPTINTNQTALANASVLGVYFLGNGERSRPSPQKTGVYVNEQKHITNCRERGRQKRRRVSNGADKWQHANVEAQYSFAVVRAVFQRGRILFRGDLLHPGTAQVAAPWHRAARRLNKCSIRQWIASGAATHAR